MKLKNTTQLLFTLHHSRGVFFSSEVRQYMLFPDYKAERWSAVLNIQSGLNFKP